MYELQKKLTEKQEGTETDRVIIHNDRGTETGKRSNRKAREPMKRKRNKEHDE